MRLGIIERMSLKSRLGGYIGRNITNVQLPELSLGMDRNLWGLTLWLWTYTLQMARRNIVEIIEDQTNTRTHQQVKGGEH